LRIRKDTTAARRGEAELESNSHHYFGLPIRDSKVPPDLRGPKPRPEQCDDGTGKKR
jgi:hypothetical protein